MSEKDLIWVSKDLKEAWEKAESEEEQKKIFFRAIEDRKLDIKNQIECLEDEVLLFKGLGIRYKTELEKIYNEQSQQLEKIWEEFNAGDRIYKKAKKIQNDLQPIVATINLINSSLSSISTYKIESLIEVIDKFNRMTEEDKTLLKVLIEHGKAK